MPLRQFIYSLGSRSSAPGGGSASAAIAAMVIELIPDSVFNSTKISQQSLQSGQRDHLTEHGFQLCLT